MLVFLSRSLSTGTKLDFVNDVRLENTWYVFDAFTVYLYKFS